MKQLVIIMVAVGMGAFAFANEPHAATPNSSAVKKVAVAKLTKEQREKCKSESKGDKKAYMDCLKTQQ